MSTKSILLIDHDASIREVLQTCLREVGGWNVTSSASVREGLDRFFAKRPDAILLDASTSEIDGLIFIEQLKRQSFTQSVPVVLLSARSDWFTLHQLQHMGFVGAIAKPFNPSTLPTEIANLLGWRIENA